MSDLPKGRVYNFFNNLGCFGWFILFQAVAWSFVIIGGKLGMFDGPTTPYVERPPFDFQKCLHDTVYERYRGTAGMEDLSDDAAMTIRMKCSREKSAYQGW